MYESEFRISSEAEENKRQRFYIYGSIIFIQIVVAFVLVTFLIFPKYKAYTMNLDKPDMEIVRKEYKSPGGFYTISNLDVYLNNAKGNRLARFENVLELEDDKGKRLVQQHESLIFDKLQAFLRAKTVEELSYYNLISDIKPALINIVNDIIPDKKVKNVYFTRFVMK